LFVEKLNKKPEGVYIIEEEKLITDGKWEGYLDHDNVNHESITIYTGPKFTGEKVENYFISTPSETPWKTYLKVFSESEKIYITYESQGDQVEAEDINQVQNVLADTVKDLNDYKAVTDASINDLEIRTTNLEETRASKTYVDTELNKVYKKEEVFTKDEVLQRIRDIIGAAPEALDTLEEIALALNEDPDFAATITNLLAQKVDKVSGKGLSTEDFTTAEKQKLAGIEDGANKYIHPSTHPASMIVETSEKRFVSDIEKATWNAKETPAGAQEKANIAETNAKSYTDDKIDDLAGVGRTTETVKEVADELVSHKANTANPHNVTKSQVGLANVDNVKQASKTEFDSHNNDTTRHITAEERTRWNNKAEVSQIPTKVSQLENDRGYVTQEELGDAGYGDMLKSTYDTDNDGKVDRAEAADSVPWDGVTGKPGTFPPSSHNHDDRYIKNTGGTIQNGDLYMDGGSVNYVRPDTTSGWARGFWWSKRDLTRIGGIGVLGSGETISKFYIGFGISPWQNSIVEIFSDSVNINGTIKQQGNEVWYKGKPLTWNDLKGV
jgi:hypothetical protein